MSELAEKYRESLFAIRVERKRISVRDHALAQQENQITEWLKAEAVTKLVENVESSSPLSAFIEVSLSNGAKLTTQDLIDLVQEEKNLKNIYGERPGRSVNALLQGWNRQGLVDKDSQKRWYFMHSKE